MLKERTVTFERLDQTDGDYVLIRILKGSNNKGFVEKTWSIQPKNNSHRKSKENQPKEGTTE